FPRPSGSTLMSKNSRRRRQPQLPSSASNTRPPRGSTPPSPPQSERMSLFDGLQQLSSVAAPLLVASRVCTQWREGKCDLWCGERWVDPSNSSWDPLRMDGWTDANGQPQFRIRNGVVPNMTIGDLPMDNDLSYRPWEISTAAVAALQKELSSN